MVKNENKKGFLGIFPQWIDLLLLLLCVTGFIWLQWWALPRQPAFMIFIISLEIIVFSLALFKPSWSLFIIILVTPGITTSTLTVFNKIYPTVKTGVFGPTALLPALAFVFGVWLRTNIKKEELQPNYLRNFLIAFMGLTVLSATVTLWRYSNFWPFTGWEIVDKIVNIDNLTSSKAKRNIIWVLVNYLTGPLLFLSICQASFLQIKTNFSDWKKWILKYIYIPFFIGSIAPIYVAFIQKKDVWFGAHKFYIWPWMNRINATFFDPNALGSYVLIAIPMTFALIVLVRSIKWQLVFPILLLSAGYIYSYLIFIGKSGSRMSLTGSILFIIIVLSLFLLIKIKNLKRKFSFKKYYLICAIVGIVYCSLIGLFIYSVPNIINKVKKSPKYSKLTIVNRFARMDIKSIGDLYAVIKKDRGVHARIAVEMIKDFPLTGIGHGAFIAELPNYRKITKEIVYVPDTACNYYLQIGSEQGIITLAIVLLIFSLWYYKWWRIIQIENNFMFWIFIGAGFSVFIVMFLFGTHTLAHEIQCLFWIFVSQPFIAKPETFKRKIKPKYLWLLLLVVCVLFISTAVSKLSLETEQKIYGWKNKSQFYPWERCPDPNVQRVRYTKKESSEFIKCNGIIFVQKWAALHPDIAKNPVKITFRLDNITTNIIARDNKWHTLEIYISPKYLNKKILFSVNISRTWKASSLGINNDNRRLGLLVNQFTWKNSNGMYKEETWNNDKGIMSNKKYRWTGKHAVMLLSPKAAFAKIPMLVSHPDINKKPVKVKLSIKNKTLAEVTFTNNSWQEIILFSEDFAKHKNTILHIDVDRTMIPKNYGIDDKRELGVAIGSPVFSDDYGFYNKELWNDRFYYNWAKKKAGWIINSKTNNFTDVYYMLSQPDITNNPVTISFYLNNKLYKKEKVNDPKWRKITINIISNSLNKIEAEVNRVWCPINYGLKDSRDLGFAIKTKTENNLYEKK